MTDDPQAKALPGCPSSQSAWSSASAAFAVALLAAVVAISYAPMLDAGWIWDDDSYVWNNATLRTATGLVDIWLKPRALPQYYPLVHTSYWLEYRLWGLDPTGYHLVNILLHYISSLLLWVLLSRLKLPAAFLAACLFAAHPICVESVAWVTERKNTLSLCLALASLLAWLRTNPFGGDQQAAAGPTGRWLIASLGLFFGSLLAKTVSVVLVGVLPVLIWWKTGRLTSADLRRLLPYFCLGLPLAATTVWLEKHHVGADKIDWGLSWLDRIMLAGRAVWFYAGKCVWPHPLAFFYDRWQIDSTRPAAWYYPAAAVAVLGGALISQNRFGRGPLAATLLFGGCLFPALGFFDVYPFRFSFVADHFAYHAMPVFIGATSVLLARLVQQRRNILYPTGLLLVTAATTLSWHRCGAFQNEETLFRDTLVKTPSSSDAANNLGSFYLGEGRIREAIPLLEQAAVLAIFPDGRSRSLTNLTECFLRLDRPGIAVKTARAANAAYASSRAQALLALALVRTGDLSATDKLLASLPASVRERPELQLTLGERALLLNDRDQAAGHFAACLAAVGPGKRDPACLEIGIAYLKASSFDAAEEFFGRISFNQQRIRGKALMNLGIAEAVRGNLAAASARLEAALAVDPSAADIHGNYGKVLLLCGQPRQALDALQTARQLSGPEFGFLAELAAAQRQVRELDAAAAASPMSPPP